MANLITTLRIVLVLVLVGLIYQLSPAWQLFNAVLLIFIFILDGVDGYVARKWNETSTFGAAYDVAADRVVENSLWIVFTHLGYTPVWVPIVFVSRGFVVDVIRSRVRLRGQTPFSMMRGPVGRLLVAGRAMRFLYGSVKAAAFGWILLLRGGRDLWPELWADWSTRLNTATQVLVHAAVTLCLVRGLPVILDFLIDESVALKSRKGQTAEASVPPIDEPRG